MADLADVLDFLQTVATAGAYPAGTANPSVTGKTIDIAQGWPMSADVDAAVKAGTSIVSIYAVPSTTGDPGQVFDWHPGVSVAPVYGLTVEIDEPDVVIAGTPNVGEILNISVNYTSSFTYVAVANDTAETVAAAMLAKIQADFPQATLSGATLTIPGVFSITAIRGGIGTLSQRIYRQRQQFRIVVWSPNPSDRTTIAQPIDIAIKSNIKVLLADQTEAIIVYRGTNLDDKYENDGVYRRDLIFSVVWDTMLAIAGTEIISVPITFGSRPQPS